MTTSTDFEEGELSFVRSGQECYGATTTFGCAAASDGHAGLGQRQSSAPSMSCWNGTRQREKDGFPRKIRVGRLIKPGKRGKEKVVIVPTTVEEKFCHDTPSAGTRRTAPTAAPETESRAM